MSNRKSLCLMAVATLILSSTAVVAADRDDASVTADVKAKITANTKIPAGSSPSVIVDTREGKVKVYGIVDTDDQKKGVEQSAKSVDGVKDVDMEIQVKGN